jgi:hypothetical protein
MMDARLKTVRSSIKRARRNLKTRPSGGARRRSLVTDILTLQFLITCAITIIALAGLTWTSGAVIRDNLTYWAEQWADELNELGAPFHLRDRDDAST